MNQLLRSCFYTAMRTHGICPNCGHDGVLPGRLNHTDQRPVCLTCAGIPGAYCCRHCGVDGEMYRRRQTTAIVLSPREMRILLSAEPVPVPAPFAGMLNHHLHNRPNLRTGGGMVANPWLFPGHYPGTHLDPQSIMQRLRKPGVNLLQGRNSALQPRRRGTASPGRRNCSATATKSPSDTPNSPHNHGRDASRSGCRARSACIAASTDRLLVRWCRCLVRA